MEWLSRLGSWGGLKGDIIIASYLTNSFLCVIRGLWETDEQLNDKSQRFLLKTRAKCLVLKEVSPGQIMGLAENLSVGGKIRTISFTHLIKESHFLSFFSCTSKTSNCTWPCHKVLEKVSRSLKGKQFPNILIHFNFAAQWILTV